MSSNTSTSPITLVVGGAGYVGSVLTRCLLDSGQSVRVLDSLLWDNGYALQELGDHPGFSFQQGDMRNPSDISRALRGVSNVILLAGLVGDPISKKYPELATSTNLYGVRDSLEASLEAGVEKLIFASTCSNYGLARQDHLVNESSPLNPLSLYAEHKVVNEEFLLSCAPSSTQISILRIATAFGLSPRMRFDLTISHFVRDAISLRRLDIFDADTWRPYCHVRDIAEAMSGILASEWATTTPLVLNVGATENNFTKRGIAELISASGLEFEIVDFGEGSDARDYRVDFARIQEFLQFKAKYSVRSHVPKLINAINSDLMFRTDPGGQGFGNFEIPRELGRSDSAGAPGSS